jgi:hypothetical protein
MCQLANVWCLRLGYVRCGDVPQSLLHCLPLAHSHVLTVLLLCTCGVLALGICALRLRVLLHCLRLAHVHVLTVHVAAAGDGWS